MKVRHFIAIGSSGDFGWERVRFKVASKRGVKKPFEKGSCSNGIKNSPIIFTDWDREHCCGGKSCLLSFH
jgi:hypothetical protein